MSYIFVKLLHLSLPVTLLELDAPESIVASQAKGIKMSHHQKGAKKASRKELSRSVLMFSSLMEDSVRA